MALVVAARPVGEIRKILRPEVFICGLILPVSHTSFHAVLHELIGRLSGEKARGGHAEEARGMLTLRVPAFGDL